MVQLPPEVVPPSELRIHGRLCLPPGKLPTTVMLALHGWTYTNQYWDVGYQPDTYSFARHMTDAGYATFAVDRLGYGDSFHPLGATVSLDVQAEVLHHLIQQLKAGEINNHKFGRVALTTHSFGSAVARLESSKHNDADALITTGWGSSAQLAPALRFISAIAQRPAPIDPKTHHKAKLDINYLTTPPGGREVDYLYDLAHVDPTMVKYDQNVLRDTTPTGEVATFFHHFNKLAVGSSDQELTLPLSSETKKINIPTFLLNGQHDLFFCGPQQNYCSSSQSLQREQAPYFSPQACARAAVTPDAGHDLNLQSNAPRSYQTIRTWADQVLGPDGANYQHYLATCQSFSGQNGTKE